MALTRDDLLQVAAVAYHNVVEAGIGEALAAAGYSEERRQAALQQAAAPRARREAQQMARGRQMALTQQVRRTLAARRQEFLAVKQAVRAADCLAGSDWYVRLSLKGKVSRNYRGFVAFARMVYHMILADEGMLQALDGLGYPRERLEGLAAGIFDLEELNRQQEMAKGDYRRCTQQVQTLEEAVRDDLRALKALVKVVFAGEAGRHLLNSLQLREV